MAEMPAIIVPMTQADGAQFQRQCHADIKAVKPLLSAEASFRRLASSLRRTFIGLRGFDYQTLLPQTLNIIPPAEVRDAWKKDYRSMQESMIYEESPSFEQLIEKLTVLNQRINALNY